MRSPLTAKTIIFCWLTITAFATPAKQVHYGHNLSPTAETLAKHQVAAGLYALAYGVSDELTVGTSPWITFDYNMLNVVVRHARDLGSGKKIAFQSHYFKSYGDEVEADGTLSYKMEAWSQFLTYSMKLAESLTVVFNVNAMYFWDGDYPFSLRRIDATDDDFQLNSTVLLQHRWSDHLLAQFELGVLGANYNFPQLILGTSGALTWGESWLLQLGFMVTTTPHALLSGPRIDNNFHHDSDGINASKRHRRDDFSVHPEIQLEYFF